MEVSISEWRSGDIAKSIGSDGMTEENTLEELQSHLPLLRGGTSQSKWSEGEEMPTENKQNGRIIGGVTSHST